MVTVENNRTGGGFPIITIWDTSSWSRIRRTIFYSKRQATTLSVGRNGKLFAIGAADGTVAVYDALLYCYFYRKELHKFVITSVCIVDDESGHLLITGSGDGTFKVIPIRHSRPWTWKGLFLFWIIFLILALFFLFCLGIIGDEDL